MRTRTKLHISGAPFNIGDLVKCELTGFTGIVTTHSRHLTGCDTVWVTHRTKTKHEADEPVQLHFDVLELELIASNPMKVEGFPEHVEPAG